MARPPGKRPTGRLALKISAGGHAAWVRTVADRPPSPHMPLCLQAAFECCFGLGWCIACHIRNPSLLPRV